MEKIPKFDEDTARRLCEILPGPFEQKAAVLKELYGIKGNFSFGTYRSHGDIVSFVENILKQEIPIMPLIETDYKKILFEPQSPRKGGHKQLFTSDQSLERIWAAGKERHPMPSEEFSFLIAGLEGKLDAEQMLRMDDMIFSYGEWLDEAWIRKRDRVVCYSGVRNLKYDGIRHVVDGNKLIYGCKEKFPLSREFPAEQWLDLNLFDDGLVQHLYSRLFAQLPKEMQQGERRARIYLPPENTLWPIGRGLFNIYGYEYLAASRWAENKNGELK